MHRTPPACTPRAGQAAQALAAPAVPSMGPCAVNRSNLDRSGMVIVRKGVIVSCADGFRFRVQRVRVGVFVGCLVDVYGREHRHVTRVEHCGVVRVVVQ